MKWKNPETALCLEERDLKIAAQCGISVTEIMGRERPNQDIPPLWSVLSYVMLRYKSGVDTVWYHHRRLQQMAADTGRWYYTRHIPKANGGTRTISVPSYEIRNQQEFIMEKILKELPVSDRAFAYRKGISIGDCAKPHIGQQVLIHLDIRDFFGSITENMVFEMFCRETGYAKSLCRFLARLCCHRGHLPQGAATSPMLSNIVFRHCDDALDAVAKKYAMHYTRYSDDLFFSAGADIPVGEFLKEIRQVLSAFGFRLNEEKTKVRRCQHRQTVLGMTVNDHLQVSRSYRRKLEQELYYLEKFGPYAEGAVACGDYLKYMQQLQGKLAYVLQVDPTNEKLGEAHRKLLLKLNRYIFLKEHGFV